jgi:hypothetical protein
MGETAAKVLRESLQVTALVFLMMVVVDVVNVFTQGKLRALLRAGPRRQYVVAPLLGTIPGCLGMFTNVSLYIHGLISFGALAGGMIAGSGDEAFVMLAMFPKKAALLFVLLFVCGMIFGRVVDALVPVLHLRPCESCEEHEYHSGKENLAHYFRKHVWRHIVRRHLVSVFLWTTGALAVAELGLRYGALQTFTEKRPLLVLLIAALLGLIPESGPHLIFVTLFAKGLVPFSVLFTSSFVQDGHGMLPLLSYSRRDFVWVKALDLVFGVGVGLGLYGLGW